MPGRVCVSNMPEFANLFCEYSNKESTFFDVGANIGLFSLAAGQKLLRSAFRRVRVRAVSIDFSDPAKKNLLKNELAMVRVVRAALSDQTGQAILYVNAELKDALNSLEAPSFSDAEVVGRKLVHTVTLDDFVARENIARVDLMKVDVEGAELKVFRGGRKLLERPDAPVILYEGYSWCTAGFHYRTLSN